MRSPPEPAKSALPPPGQPFASAYANGFPPATEASGADFGLASWLENRILLQAQQKAMGSSDTRRSSPGAVETEFRTTRWTRVCKARQPDTPSASEALSQLCRDYWYPLYAFVRRRGHPPEDAQDLTQSFFARLLEKQYLQRADPERGRFRTFLLSSINNFLSNEWDKKKTIKRGGQCFFVSWDELDAENRYGQEAFLDLSAEKLYDRRWAMTVLDKVGQVLRREHALSGELALFEALQGSLTGTDGPQSYKALAAGLNLTEDAVRMRLHRLKRRFGKVLREVVADTVAMGEDVEEEMRQLVAAWS
jgi:RNA polymerase sigma factor (sigma-70 family)